MIDNDDLDFPTTLIFDAANKPEKKCNKPIKTPDKIIIELSPLMLAIKSFLNTQDPKYTPTKYTPTKYTPQRKNKA